MDEQEKMARMNVWLDAVCTEYGIDREAIARSVPGLLQMSRDVAHGPARPGVPVTGFVLGYAAAQLDKPLAEAAETVLGQLQPLLEPYRDEK